MHGCRANQRNTDATMPWLCNVHMFRPLLCYFHFLDNFWTRLKCRLHTVFVRMPGIPGPGVRSVFYYRIICIYLD